MLSKALLLAVVAATAVVAIDEPSRPLYHGHGTSALNQPREVFDERVAAMRSAMKDDTDRVARLDKDDDRDAHRRRGSRSPRGKAGSRIRRFLADAQRFDLRKAKGIWYQQAANREFVNRYYKACSCPLAAVRVKSDTESMVDYMCVNKSGDLVSVRGLKRMLSPGKFSLKMQEKRIGEKIIKSKDTDKESGDEIIALDNDLQWKVMYNAKENGVFIYSRKPKLDKELMHELLHFIEKYTDGKIAGNDMKMFEHKETCEKLRPVLREFMGKYDEKMKLGKEGKGEEKGKDEDRRSGSQSPRHHNKKIVSDASSGAEPAKDAPNKDAAPEQQEKLDLNLLKGQWFEVARSRLAGQTTERGCACGLAFYDVSESTINTQYVCLNSSAKGELATASGRMIMDPKQEGVFRSKMLSLSPGKLSEDESIERKVILLALGDEFAAMLEPDRKVVHILSRKTTMDKELIGALKEMVQTMGIDPKDLEKIDQAAGTCSAFHEKAKTKFGAAAKPSVAGLDKKKGVEQTGAGDTRDEKVAGSAALRDDKGEERTAAKSASTEFNGVQPMMAAPGDAQWFEAQPLGGVQAAAPVPDAAAPAPDDQNEQAPPPLDANVLGGNWFDIAVSQAAYDLYHKGCECTQAFIQPLDSNRLHIVGGCMNKTDNQLVTCIGGAVQDPSSPGLFRFQELDKQPYGLSAQQKGAIHEKVVLAVGADFAVIAEPALNSVWLLSRTPKMVPDLYERLVTLIDKIGFPKANLRKTNHELPECEGVTKQMQAIGKQAGEQATKPSAEPAAPAAPAPAAPAATAAPAAPAPAVAPAAAPPAIPTAATPLPAAPAPAAAPTAPAPTARAPAAATLPAQLPRAKAIGGEQPLAGEQQYAENPAYYGGDYYAAEQQPLMTAQQWQQYYADD